MGGSKTQSIQQPTAPTVQSSMSDYVQNYPAMMQLMQQYAPQEAALQVQLANQYAEPLGAAYQKAQQAMYPEEYKLSQQLNQQTLEGMQGDVPDWMKKEYLSNYNAALGTNVGSPAGADATSVNLLKMKQDWRNYYNNMALSITGRQPIAQASAPQYTNQLQGYTANNAMGFNQGMYGNQASLYGNMYGINTNYTPPWQKAAATVAGTALGSFMGGGMGGGGGSMGFGMGY